jgi:uncharacterized protein (TIGR02996 family)
MPRKPPPTTGELLLRAVFAHPEDDAPRLAYADWLDESGGVAERAAFIRVQCELARLPWTDTRRADLQPQEIKLLRGRKLKWRRHLPKFRGVVWGDFSRGFIDSVTLKSTYQFRRYSARIAETIPLHAVRVRPARDYERQMTGFGRMKALARVSDLHLSAQRIDDERLAQLLGSPHLGRVSRLILSDNRIGDEGARLLAADQVLPALKVLDLRNNKVGDVGGRALSTSVLSSRLDLLVLAGNRLSPGVKRALQAAFPDRVIV